MRSWTNSGRRVSGRPPSRPKPRSMRASSPPSMRQPVSRTATWSAPPRPGTPRWVTRRPTAPRAPDSGSWRRNAVRRLPTKGPPCGSWSRICRGSWATSARASTRFERLALARIIGGTAEPAPLLLDEALVHADRRRVRAALDELGRLGQDHQIILFSKDESLADRAEKAADWTIIRLPGPPGPGSAEGAPANGSRRVSEEEEVPSV